ncbi:hypothetical protein Tco_1070332 [Tanacetum coccineum]|uniref:Zinc finger, CCHC-type n=1 Tax=Tanacetum coccineum TaxID=301880 RepID=A0ABQ5HLE3_9ASTR
MSIPSLRPCMGASAALLECKRDTVYQRQVFTRKLVFTIPNTAYPPSAIRHYKVNDLALSVRHPTYHETPPDQMAVAAHNTNNMTIRSILLAEKLIGSNFTNWYRNLRIVLSTMRLSILSKRLHVLCCRQAKHELFEIVKAFNSCKQEEGQSVSSYLLKIKSYLDTLERLGYVMPNELGVSLILNSLNKNYDQFIQNYNMHSMGKTIAKLHAMLKLYEKGIPKKTETPAVLAMSDLVGVMHLMIKNCKLVMLSNSVGVISCLPPKHPTLFLAWLEIINYFPSVKHLHLVKNHHV